MWTHAFWAWLSYMCGCANNMQIHIRTCSKEFDIHIWWWWFPCQSCSQYSGTRDFQHLHKTLASSNMLFNCLVIFNGLFVVGSSLIPAFITDGTPLSSFDLSSFDTYSSVGSSKSCQTWASQHLHDVFDWLYGTQKGVEQIDILIVYNYELWSYLLGELEALSGNASWSGSSMNVESKVCAYAQRKNELHQTNQGRFPRRLWAGVKFSLRLFSGQNWPINFEVFPRYSKYRRVAYLYFKQNIAEWLANALVHLVNVLFTRKHFHLLSVRGVQHVITNLVWNHLTSFN